MCMVFIIIVANRAHQTPVFVQKHLRDGLPPIHNEPSVGPHEPRANLYIDDAKSRLHVYRMRPISLTVFDVAHD